MGDPPPLRLKREAAAGSSFDTVQPNPEFVEMLVGMGFPINLAQVGNHFLRSLGRICICLACLVSWLLKSV